MFVHVVDAAADEGGDPVKDVETINRELEGYNPELLKRPQIIAANKTDLPGAMENVTRLTEKYGPMGFQVFPISAAAMQGIDGLMEAVAEALSHYPEDIVFEEEYEELPPEIIDSEPFKIEVFDDDYYVVTGTGVEKMLGYTNIDTEKGFAFFQKYLREKGIIAALEEKGIKDKDTVKIYDLEFEYFK